jgi:hypothetical protein
MRSLCEVQLPGQRVDVLNGGDVAPDGRLLSVAEIQQAFRELRTRNLSDIATPSASKPEPTSAGPSIETVAHHGGDIDERWVSVIAAHAGAGASTVALAVADAAATAGRGTHLVETAHPTRSGLVAAANAELGVDASGAWRRGSRGQLTIARRADSDVPTCWPALTAPGDGLVVVDLGLPTPDSLTRLVTSGCRIVVVCRPTVPGVRLAEQVLDSITGPVIVASVGGKWTSQITASLGPLLRELRANNAVVYVPTDRRLEVTGPTTSPLPKPVATAGHSLLTLINAAHPNDATTRHQPAARSAQPGKETGQWSLR